METFVVGFLLGAIVMLVIVGIALCFDDVSLNDIGFITKLRVRKFKKGCVVVKMPVSAFDADKASYKYIVDAKFDLNKRLELLVLNCDKNGDCSFRNTPDRIYADKLLKECWKVLKRRK